jgi:hypothetical protein
MIIIVSIAILAVIALMAMDSFGMLPEKAPEAAKAPVESKAKAKADVGSVKVTTTAAAKK